MKKSIIALILVLALFMISCENSKEKDTNKTEGEDKSDGMVDIKEIDANICEKSGGKWNECGSPCAGTNAEVCIQMCSQQCECGGIAGWKCPEGYKCRLTGKIADEMGVCVK